MKNVIISAALCSAALCSAAVALAGSANADEGSDFLVGSTNALILGSTGLPTPDASYLANAVSLYLDPSGYDGTSASALALSTPETWDFGSSVTQGEQILVTAVLAEYALGDMHCTVFGDCSDPLTIFSYSQSSAVAALAEQELAAAKIPTDALRFVMLGANPSGVPDNLYPTEVFNIDGDVWANPASLGSTWDEILFGLEQHFAYMWLTPAELESATPVVEGLTTVFDIPTLTTTELWEALLNSVGLAGA